MDDARWAEIEARRERNAYFRGLEKAAAKAATRKPVVSRVKVSARPDRTVTARVRRPWGLTWPKPIGPKVKPKMGRPKTAPDACLGCKRLFRPRRTSIKEYPNTVYHVGHGYCRTCDGYRQKRPEDRG